MIVRQADVIPFDFYGLEIRDYTARQEGSSSIAEIIVPSGASHPEACSKRSDKFYYLISGQISFHIDGDQLTLHAGDLCLIKRGQHFSYSNHSPKLAKMVLVHTPSFDLESEVIVEYRA
ncbi:MAG: cupin domain-containing protein [Thermodesulfobacteriota bacterium]|jgi:mannose-6-phosphate isomerase-like protein (cupin superfamily)